jgi:hypothetical protein
MSRDSALRRPAGTAMVAALALSAALLSVLPAASSGPPTPRCRRWSRSSARCRRFPHRHRQAPEHGVLAEVLSGDARPRQVPRQRRLLTVRRGLRHASPYTTAVGCPPRWMSASSRGKRLRAGQGGLARDGLRVVLVTCAHADKVDGFPFDLTGHALRANMVAVRSAFDTLTERRDGVDGRAIYLYGEGWKFGPVADNARFYQATQGQPGGTGIGTSTTGPVTRSAAAVRSAATPACRAWAPVSRRTQRSGGQRRRGQAGRDAGARHRPRGARHGGEPAGLRVPFARKSRPTRGDAADYNGSPTGYAAERRRCSRASAPTRTRRCGTP